MARDKNLYGIGSLSRFIDAENFGLLLNNINGINIKAGQELRVL